MTTDLLDRVSRIAAAAADTHEARRERNRQRYPELAAFLDEIREWDPGAKVTRVTEASDGN